MKFRDASTPVVLLRSVGHGGLCITRTLGRMGVVVDVVDGDPTTPAFSSRFCQRRMVLDLITTEPESAVRQLLQLQKQRGQRCVLLPASDDAAIFVADHAVELSKGYIFPQVAPELVHRLCSKKDMFFLVRQLGLPTPESVFPRSRLDLLDFVERATFPVLLKGIDGQRLLRTARKKMFIINSRRELLDLYDATEDHRDPNLMVQEYVAQGEDWMFNGYFDANSQCLFGMTGRKIRQCPAFTGATALGVCMHNDVVDETARHLVEAIGYRGALDIDVRRDYRDGKYKILDVNPRVGASFRLFVDSNDLDTARALYLDLTGQTISPTAPQYGRKWLVEDLDVACSIRYGRCGELNLLEWLSSLRGVRETAYLSFDDPLPALRMVLNDARTLLRRLRQPRVLPQRECMREREA